MKQQKNGKKIKKNSKLWMIVSVILVIAFIGGLLLKNLSRSEKSMLDQLHDKQGYIRTVGIEEYEFFKKLVDRDTPDNLTEEEFDEQTRQRINRANAEFMLAAQMDLCLPYSFESLQRDMENENNQRKLKKEKGEVFYGPEKFNLITYYNYILTNLKLDMVSFIMENADEQIMEGSRAYFDEFSEKYLTVKEIKYLLNENEKQEEIIVKGEELSTLEKIDSTLFEFLYYGKENDTLDYLYRDRQRTVQIISVEYEEHSFENNLERVVRDYITNVYLETWIHEVEEAYPVEFKLN